MSQNNILQIIPYVSSKYGGPPYVAKSLNNIFNNNGYISKVLTAGEYEKSENVIFFKLTTNKFWFSYDFMFNSIKYIKNSNTIFVHGLYNFITLWASLIAFIHGKKIYLLPHGMLDKNSINSSGFVKNSIRSIFLYTLGIFQIKASNKVIFNSQKEKDNSILVKTYAIIPNGVDLDYINNVKCKKKYFEQDKISLFFLGRLNKIKGIELILEAINKLDDSTKKNIELVIAGTGHDKYVDFLRGVSNKNIVKFIGHIDGDDKYCYLKQCDIYLQPSFTEGLSLSMLEAMSCKVNMITTNKVGLFEELLEENAAKVIDYDSKQLELAITELIMSGKNKFKENSYKMVEEKYNWNFILKDYINLI
jgi:glycosyltransferase involved in cell wall biosynthesis